MIDINIDCIPPKHTAQGSNQILKTKNGRFFIGKKTNSNAKSTQNELFNLLYPYRPEQPLEKPLRVEIKWVYPYRKSEPKKNRTAEKYCDTRPDVDNICKLLFDMMTRIGFWIDDSQIADLHFIKVWDNKPRIEIKIGEL